jgi:hypothetical protein
MSGEIFNRILTRKKYLCRYVLVSGVLFWCSFAKVRSKAVQIGMNLVVLEEWVEDMGLPRGIVSHLTPVKDLLHWLRVSS